MENNTYLSYLIHELNRWGKIGSHSIDNQFKETERCVDGIVDQLLTCLHYGFPEVYKYLVNFVIKEAGQC